MHTPNRSLTYQSKSNVPRNCDLDLGLHHPPRKTLQELEGEGAGVGHVMRICKGVEKKESTAQRPHLISWRRRWRNMQDISFLQLSSPIDRGSNMYAHCSSLSTHAPIHSLNPRDIPSKPEGSLLFSRSLHACHYHTSSPLVHPFFPPFSD